MIAGNADNDQATPMTEDGAVDEVAPSEIHHFKYKIHHLKYKVHHFNTKFIVFNTNSDTTATIRPRIHTRAHACTGTSQHFAREIEWEIADSLSLPLYLSGGLGRAAEAEGNY